MDKHRFQYKLLTSQDLTALHQAFKQSFSGYQVRIDNNIEALKYRLQRIGSELSVSAAVWDKQEIIAFIIQAIGSYEGIKTAYNGGTGVLQNHRGQGLATDLYHFAFEKNKSIGIEQCLLEVIDNNEPAIRVYKKLGFEITRSLICYLGIVPKSMKGNTTIQLLSLKDRLPNWSLYQSFFDFEPCWQNSFGSIIRNFENEQIIEAVYRTKTVGFVIFEPLKSRITQLAVDHDFRRKGIGVQLLRTASHFSQKTELTILNINDAALATNHFLQACGMRKKITQYEMVKLLL